LRQLTIVQNSLNQLDTSPIIFEEISNILNSTLKKLPPKTKKIFELPRFDYKKNSEIAKDLGISIKSVEAHITESLKILRITLRNYLPFVIFLMH
jgi:RNA polymerase sigma-70 factor, ECF subfamily